MIHTDGTHNTLVHKRTMYMENLEAYEFWGPERRDHLVPVGLSQERRL